MKTIKSGVLIVAFSIIAATPTLAQQQPANDRWCWYARATLMCRAATYEQCMASRHETACFLNPKYEKKDKKKSDR
jgi:hypothetical protein